MLFFIYYCLYHSYINSIFCSYTIANSSSNITPSKKSIYSPPFWGGAGGEAVEAVGAVEAVVLQTLVSLTCDNVELLLASKVDELNSVATYTDGEVSILWLLWMFHSVLELVYAKYVDIQVVSTL